MLERLAAVPGVRSVALTNPALLSGSVTGTSFFVQGRTYGPDERVSVHRLVISPNFFELMQIPVLSGRTFNARDHETAPKVAMINATAAQNYFPGEAGDVPRSSIPWWHFTTSSGSLRRSPGAATSAPGAGPHPVPLHHVRSSG